MSETADRWAGQIRAGDVRAVARAITAIENRDPVAEELLRRVFVSTGRAQVVGITGAPGNYRRQMICNQRVGHWSMDTNILPT